HIHDSSCKISGKIGGKRFVNDNILQYRSGEEIDLNLIPIRIETRNSHGIERRARITVAQSPNINELSVLNRYACDPADCSRQVAVTCATKCLTTQTINHIQRFSLKGEHPRVVVPECFCADHYFIQFGNNRKHRQVECGHLSRPYLHVCQNLRFVRDERQHNSVGTRRQRQRIVTLEVSNRSQTCPLS